MVEGRERSELAVEMPMRMSTRKTVERAKRLRRTMSPAEVLLWQALRARPGGYKFRHEHAAEFCSLDFYCPKAALCIEVDGDAHNMGDNPARDERRDAWLCEQGIETVRIPAKEVFDDLAPVVTLIVEKCAARSPSTPFGGPPPPQRRGRMS
jgi:very-short-patch-repair endonuclease